MVAHEYYHLDKDAKGLHIDALDLTDSKRLRAVHFSYVMPHDLIVPDGCTVRFGGDAGELRPQWGMVRRLSLLSKYCLVRTRPSEQEPLPLSQAEPNVAFITEQACEILSKLIVWFPKVFLCAPKVQPLRFGANLRNLKLLYIICGSLSIKLAACLRLRWLCLDVERRIDAEFKDASMLASACRAARCSAHQV